LAEGQEKETKYTVPGISTPARKVCGIPTPEFLHGRKVVHHKGDVERRAGFDYNEYKEPEKNRTWHYRAAKDA
jgi:hypothetical protein